MYGTTAYYESHNGGRAGPVDREDGVAKNTLSNNFSLQALGMSQAGLFGCRSLPLAVTYLHYLFVVGVCQL